MGEQQAAFWHFLLHSIYGNVLQQPNSIDICGLFSDMGAATQPLVRQLLDAPSLSLDVNTEEEGAGQFIKSLYFEAANRLKQQGNQTLGFGYPLFCTPDESAPDGITAIPVFLWQLEIKPSQTQADIYHLLRTFHQQVRPNPLFVHYLQKKYDFNEAKCLYDACSNFKITAEKVLSACNQIAIGLSIETANTALNVQVYPSQTEIRTLKENAPRGQFIWAGCLGVFPALGIQNLHLLNRLATANNPFLNDELFKTRRTTLKHSFSDSSNLNTRQEAVLRQLPLHQNLAVYAPSGSGKAELIHSILSNALANGAKCLIVSPLNTTIQAAQAACDRMGYTDLTFRLQEPTIDKPLLINSLQTAVGSAKSPPSFKEEEYRIALNAAQRLQLKCDKSYHALAQPLLGDSGWTEMVGQFLSNQHREGKQTLNGYLSPKSWTFSEAVLQNSLVSLRQTRLLYDALGATKHSLGNLHRNHFLQKTNQEAFDFVHSQTIDLLQDAKRLHRDTNHLIEEYADALDAHYSKYFLQFSREAAAIREDLGDYNTQYGEDFNRKSGLKTAELFIKGIFSSKHKNILEVRDEVQLRYDRLFSAYRKRPYFPHRFTPQKAASGFETMSQELSSFEQAMQQWRQRLPDSVREEANRLSTTNLRDETGMMTAVAELDAHFHAYISHLNLVGLYEAPFEPKIATMPQQKDYLEQIIEQLEKTEHNLRDFDVFYAWQNNWLQLSENMRHASLALIKTKPADWEAAFSSWFLYQTLALQPHDLLPEDDEQLRGYESALAKITEFIPAKIKNYWAARQYEQVKRLKTANKSLFGELNNRKDTATLQARSLTDLIKLDFDLLTESFPVLMVSPHIVADYFPEKENYFDVVIIDDADVLLAGQGVGAMWRAKHTVIIAENDASAANSLWAFAMNCGFVRLNLTQIYHKTHPKFSRLSNAMFHAHGLEVLPTTIDVLNASSVMSLKQVNGIYYPKIRINEDEAQEVVKMLNLVAPNAYNNYPSVGIACFTYEQRNLVSDYLQRIKQQKQPGYDRIVQLEKCGLGVFHISELEGVNKDVVYVSTTYGMDYLQQLTDDINELHAPIATNYIQMLLAMPNAQVTICTSIPHGFVQAQLKREGNDALRLMAIYLAYAEAVEDNQPVAEQQLLDILVKTPPASSFVVAPSFNEQVRLELVKYIEPSRVQTNVWVDNLPVDILIQPTVAGAPAIAVITDGFFSRGAYDTFCRESELVRRLEARGCRYYPLYTKQWWRQPSLEARKLAGSFLQEDTANEKTQVAEEATQLPQPSVSGVYR